MRRRRDGTLYAHMARANEHDALLAATAEAMVIFSGPHAYISPSWYDDRATAPTWDYVAVHCYGRARIHDPAATRENIQWLISEVEAEQPSPWTLEELERADTERMLRNIVSFEIPLDRVEGKFKLNQGEKAERTRAAIHRLEQSGPGGLPPGCGATTAIDCPQGRAPRRDGKLPCGKVSSQGPR